MSDVLYEEINILEDRVLKLLSDLKRLKSENEYLRELLTKKEELIKDFQNQGKSVNIVEKKGLGNVDEFEEKLEESIRIIDDCISQLSK